jgi:hypothetical protein
MVYVSAQRITLEFKLIYAIFWALTSGPLYISI